MVALLTSVSMFVHFSEGCGRSVAIALADMHECEPKKGVKRFRGTNVNQLLNKCSEDVNQHVAITISEDGSQHVTNTSSGDVNQHAMNRSSEDVNQHATDKRFENQPVSPFRLFIESFFKTCNGGNMIEIDRKGFEIWKNMSKEERKPYVLQAAKLESAYQQALDKEANDMIQVDDEADSAMVGKIDKFYQFCCDEPSDYSEYYSEDSDVCFTLEE
ncbi:high mobility group B protein 7-like isoform X2 [Neltuma alba]|uniref:high mobility group B protein 7-like isoform X2 n=1 Tax=Neltuma alba TaxID=207710 RepID=UPI0010A527C7|nr:high mobility group B protein 7-like isoform X2 [Prosopis alba]